MLVFTAYNISRTQSFQEIRPFVFQARVVLKPLVSLMGRLVACGARISVDTQTDRQTDRQNDYRNPRCAYAPRVNDTDREILVDRHAKNWVLEIPFNNMHKDDQNEGYTR